MFWHRRRATPAPQRAAFEVSPNATAIDRFVSLALASGLVRFSDLVNACAGFERVNDEPALEKLIDHLVKKQILTKWQCGKLRVGKWKGFFQDDYRFRSPLNLEDPNNVLFIADRISIGDRVAVKVTRLKSAPWLECTIVEEFDQTLLID